MEFIIDMLNLVFFFEMKYYYGFNFYVRNICCKIIINYFGII